MKFARWSFFVICISIALSLLVTGCVQIVDAQARDAVFFFQTSSSGTVSLEHDVNSSSNGSISSDPVSSQPASASSIKSTLSGTTSGKSSSGSSQAVTAPSIKTSVSVAAATVKIAVKAAPTKTPAPKPATTAKIVIDKLIGQTSSQIITVFGQPKAKELSEYGFTWYVYNSDYKRFLMIGIADNKVVGVYSNSSSLSFRTLTVGKPRATVRSTLLAGLGKPLTGIQKGNCRYTISNTEQKDVFFDGISYTTIFYDNIEGGTLTSIQIIEKNKEHSIGYYGTPSAALSASYERISFYLVNAIRSRKGVALLVWDNKLAGIARAHSTDMYKNNYFSHTNLKGLNSSARFKAAGLSYRDCAENIAKNHPSAINAHESFMNSAGHRKNVLRLCKNVGIGVYIGNNSVLLTQDFITYK